jgi:hypothetical protein
MPGSNTGSRGLRAGRRGHRSGFIVDADRLGHDLGGRRVIGLDREGGVDAALSFASADQMLGSLGVIVRPTLRSNAGVPFRLGLSARREASPRLCLACRTCSHIRA